MTVSGAYGFRLSGLEEGAWLGVSGASHWAEISCRRDSRPGAPEVSLEPGDLRLCVRSDIAHSELVHPLLGRVASRLALAHGFDGMHAGAVAGSSGAWAVIGPKGAGKSTLLASLNDAGVPVVTDDVLVFRDGVAMAGPRCIDLRPGTQLARKVKVGNFVETKKAIVGEGSKLPHLSYIGDADVGAGVNIGAGTITCNYDGVNKHKTVIEDGVFIGSDSQLVAPIRVGKGAYVGAGSTITKDVPADALSLTRAPQKTIEGWAARKREERAKK